MKKKRVLIIDQLNLFFRSYIVNPTLSSNGYPIGGLVGVIKSLQKICRETKPDRIVICWDGEGGSTKRKLLKKDYKAGRKPIRHNREIHNLSETAEKTNKRWQLERTVEYLNEMPVLQFMFNGIEADDVIAYICKTNYLKGWEKIIVSSDKDFFQLVDDETILYRPIQKKIVSKKTLIEEFNIHPNNFAMARAMVGDKSDNLEGVGGMGLKTVAKRYPFFSKEHSVTLDEIREHSQEMLSEKKIKAYENVVNNSDILERNYHMMQLYTPSMSINSKKHIHETLTSPDLSFNKTEVIRMMAADGFEDLDWLELQASFRRIALDN